MSDGADGHRGQRRMTAWVLLAAIVAVAVIAGSIWGRTAWRWVHGHGGNDQVSSSSTTPVAPIAAATASPTATPDAGQPDARHLSMIAPASAASMGAAPKPAAVAAAINKVSRAGLGTVGVHVVDPVNGQVLDDVGGASAMLPASTNKVLTSTTVLDALGPWKRFTTKVVSTSRGHLVLVGGGDPFLMSKPASGYPARPTTAQLATDTARALRAQGVHQVNLGFDDSLFTGPGWNPTWPASYRDQVSSIDALLVDEGAATRQKGASATPAATAASTFAQQLRAQGITVTGAVARTTAASTAQQVAAVQSLPLATLVQQTLLHSDNTAAEVLLRQAALASGQPGSFTGGVATAQQRLTKLGLWAPSAHLVDGSGLSRADRVTPTMLCGAIRVASTSAGIAPLLDGLPVAGITGTLTDRFFLPATAGGRGVVHVKTGTLSHVSTFAGWTLTRSGHPLVFSFMVNGADPAAKVTAKTPGTNDWNMRTWLDTVATQLTALP